MKPFFSSRPLRIGVLAILFSVTVYFLFLEDFARKSILIPVHYFLWLTGLYIRSVDQVVIWGILIGISLGLIFNILLVKPARLSLDDYRDDSPSQIGRISHWNTYLKMMKHSYFSEYLLADELKRLLLSIHASRYHKSPSVVETLILAGEISVPDEVFQFLFNRNLFEDERPGSFTQLKRWISRISNPKSQYLFAERQKKLEDVIRYLEIQVSNLE